MNHTTGIRPKNWTLWLLRAKPLWHQAGLCALGAALVPASAGALALPVYLGFLLSLEADRGALAGALGCCAGVVLFRQDGELVKALGGIVTALFAIAAFSGTVLWKRSWFAPTLAGIVGASLELVFLLTKSAISNRDLWGLLMQTAAAAGSALVFRRRSQARDPVTDAAAGALLCLGLCQAVLFGALDLGIMAGVFLTCLLDSLPGALLCGLAVDLSAITKVPVTPVLALTYLAGTLPGRHPGRRLRLSPVVWSIPAMYLGGTFDPVVPLSLLAGSLASLPLPEARPREAAPAPQKADRLAIAAQALDYVGSALQQSRGPSPEGEFLRDRLCAGCGSPCGAALSPGTCLPEGCPHGDRMESVLRDLRVRRQYFARRQAAEAALSRQYLFLADFLRKTGASLENPSPPRPARYRVELGTAAWGKFGPGANGDRGAHFEGPGGVYYVALCDGMGSGLGAAGESEGALHLLTDMLRAGLPPQAALGTLNDLYVLRDTGGFSTADLLEIHLDSGRARLYKWGSAPSYLKYRSTARPLGTAAPPPGLGGGKGPEVLSLSMTRGETLVLVTDGLGGNGTRERIAAFTGGDPKALAKALLEDAPGAQDDCTAVAVRLALCP